MGSTADVAFLDKYDCQPGYLWAFHKLEIREVLTKPCIP